MTENITDEEILLYKLLNNEVGGRFKIQIQSYKVVRGGKKRLWCNGMTARVSGLIGTALVTTDSSRADAFEVFIFKSKEGRGVLTQAIVKGCRHPVEFEDADWERLFSAGVLLTLDEWLAGKEEPL